MGALSIALAKAATEAGVEIKTDSDVDRVLVVEEQAAKVVLKSGAELDARPSSQTLTRARPF